MAEGGMAEVVEEGRRPRQAALARRLARRQEPAAAGGEGVVGPAGEVHGTQDVAEPAVLGAREDEEGEAELMDGAQALQGPAVDQRRLERVGADEAVDGVAERE